MFKSSTYHNFNVWIRQAKDKHLVVAADANDENVECAGVEVWEIAIVEAEEQCLKLWK